LGTVLDEELSRLPEKYRVPLVLCYLEGQTQEEAARQVGVARSTLQDRLERGRELLRGRLERRGVLFSTGLLATALSQGAASAALSPALIDATVEAALAFGAGEVLTGALTAQAVTLAKGALQAMVVTKLKVMAVAGLAVGLLGLGAGGLTHHVLASKQAAEGRADTPKLAVASARPQAAETGEKPARTDRFGDPLPEGATARLGTMRFRHGEAMALAFTADGKTLLTCGGADRIIRFWDSVTGRLLREQPLPDGYPLALSPDGRLLLQTGREGTLSLWEIQGHRRLHQLPLAQQGYLQAFFSPDSKMLITAQFDGTLKVWDVATGQSRLVGKHEGQPWSFSFAADGTLLSTSSDPKAKGSGRILHFWDLTAGRERARLNLAGVLNGVVLSPDGRTVASWSGHGGDFDKGVQFWDAATGQPTKGWVAPTLKRVFSVQFAPDGKTVAVSTVEDTLIWDPVAGKRVRTLRGGYGDLLTYSPDGKTLAALRQWSSPWSPRTTALLVWDVATGTPRAGAEQGPLDEVASVALSPDGRTVASASYAPYSGNGTACLWDAATGRQLCSLPVGRMTFSSLIFSRDSTHLFVATRPAVLRLDVATGREAGRYPLSESGQGDNGYLSSVKLTDDGRTLLGVRVVSSRRGPGGAPPGADSAGVTLALCAWDVATSKRLPAPTITVAGPGTDWAGYSRFSADGWLLALPSGIIFDTTTGKELSRLPTDSKNVGTAVAFSPDGSLIAVSEDPWRGQKVHVWEVATLLPVMHLETGGVAHLAFTPDGRRLITAGLESLRLWDLPSGRELARRPAHGRFRGTFGPSVASSLALGADGHTLATGHPDTTILLWDLAAPSQPAPPRSPAEREACWVDLAGADASRALAALVRLIDDREPAVKLLRERLRPVHAPPADELQRLIADLDNAQFGRREAARQRLAQWGELSEAALQEALRGKPTLETRRRIEELLAGPRLVREPEVRRALRAVRVLEQIGTPEARQVLESLAKGAPAARLTREAKVSLERLAKRPATAP
jgi:WD40 repeat protein